MRGINEIILALIFVAAIGLGPFAGVLALAVHGAGMLGKFFAEAIEDIDDGPLEAFRSAGVGRFKTIVFGVLPQVLPPGSEPSSTGSKPTCGRRPFSAWWAQAASALSWSPA